MHIITQENLDTFRPSYPPYTKRLETHIPLIGVKSDLTQKQYIEALHAWNHESAIGFTEHELNILSLIYPLEEANIRFTGTKFMHTRHGGNTAEHPIFMGHAFDKFKDAAAYTPENFDPESSECLIMAQLSQKVHSLIAVHDIGELVDISHDEAYKVGATFKEPDEEKLIAPFKFQLAAYALSVNNPSIYTDTITSMREAVQQAKTSLFERAKSGEISGSDFVNGVGAAIKAQIDEKTHKIEEDKTLDDYKTAAETLSEIATRSQAIDDLPSHLMNLCDKYEGSAHFIAFLDKAGEKETETYARFYNHGESLSYMMATSPDIMSNLRFLLKPIAPAFASLALETDEEQGKVQEKLLRAVAADALRSGVRMLQKAPPFINFAASLNTEPPVNSTADQTQQQTQLSDRLNIQKIYKKTAPRGQHKYPITALDGVMDTKAVIAIFEKAAGAVESGEWTPSGTHPFLFLIGESLPEPVQIKNLGELHQLSKQYPLEAKSVNIKH